PVVTFLGVTFILLVIVITGKYWTFEKLTLFFCIFNFVYIPAAIWGMNTPTAPGWGEVLRGFYSPNLQGGMSKDLLFIILANIGTTIAPWMIFFQQSAVVDKGMDIHDIKFGQLDTFVGSFLTCLVAVFIIIATGAVLYYHDPRIIIEDVKQTAEAIVPLLPGGQGELAKKLFAIGLFDAGFLGAVCISLSSSWAVGEVFGWAHSLNHKVKDAPWFYVIYLGMLLSSGAVVLIPGAPLVTITMFVQVVAVTVLPAALVFLLLLLNDKSVMGDLVNTRSKNIANWTIVILVTVMSTLLGVQTLFPQLFE
ncbi:MAG: NRAMP family divalent metal transporter, partial [Desulfomonilaceae bacterium]